MYVCRLGRLIGRTARSDGEEWAARMVGENERRGLGADGWLTVSSSPLSFVIGLRGSGISGGGFPTRVLTISLQFKQAS